MFLAALARPGVKARASRAKAKWRRNTVWPARACARWRRLVIGVLECVVCADGSPRAWRVVSNDCGPTLGQADVPATAFGRENIRDLDDDHARFGIRAA